MRLRIGGVAALTLAVGVVAGLIGLTWPLFVGPDSPLIADRTAPWLFALLLPVITLVMVAQLSDGGIDSKAVAMLGVLTAVGAIIRPLGGGTGGVETLFVLLVFAGRVFGPGFGFILGNTAMLASALLTAGVGPWLPYQMVAASWVGLGAGLLPRARWLPAELTLLALYGAAGSLMFGLAMNLSFWPYAVGTESDIAFQPGAGVLDNGARLVGFSVATSLGWDLGRAVTTVVLVVLVGAPTLRVFRRAARRAAFLPAAAATEPAIAEPTAALPTDAEPHDAQPAIVQPAPPTADVPTARIP